MLAPKTPLKRYWVSATGIDSEICGFDDRAAAVVEALNKSRRLKGSYVGVSDRTQGYRVVAEFRNGEVL
jgi:hypothetical protein